MQKRKISKNIAIACTICILLGTTFTSIVNAKSDATDKSMGIVPITCKIFTLKDIKEIRREINISDIGYINSLRNCNEYALYKGLKSFGLIEDLSVEEFVDMMDGKWQKNICNGFYMGKYKGLFNILCSVNATGYMSMYPMVFLNSMWLLQYLFFLLWVYGLLPEWLEKMFDRLLDIIYPPVISLFDFYSSLPKKLPLFRGYLCGNNMTLKTKGVFGVKERIGGAVYRMRGFTGIWITNAQTNYSWIRGFALSVVQAW